MGMSLALLVPGRPGAPRNGLYFRMENDNFKQRFKNGLRMEILGDVAYMVYPRSRAKKSYTLKLTATDDASIIDWAPVHATWQSGRLEFACVEEVPGLLEDSDKFWKLEEEYPAEKVALRRSELQTQPPLALLMWGTMPYIRKTQLNMLVNELPEHDQRGLITSYSVSKPMAKRGHALLLHGQEEYDSCAKSDFGNSEILDSDLPQNVDEPSDEDEVQGGIIGNRACGCCGGPMEQNIDLRAAIAIDYCDVCGRQPLCGSCAHGMWWQVGVPMRDFRWERLTAAAAASTTVRRTAATGEVRIAMRCCHCLGQLDTEHDTP